MKSYYLIIRIIRSGNDLEIKKKMFAISIQSKDTIIKTKILNVFSPLTIAAKFSNVEKLKRFSNGIKKNDDCYINIKVLFTFFSITIIGQ